LPTIFCHVGFNPIALSANSKQTTNQPLIPSAVNMPTEYCRRADLFVRLLLCPCAVGILRVHGRDSIGSSSATQSQRKNNPMHVGGGMSLILKAIQSPATTWLVPFPN